MFENHRKIASEASYVYFLRRQKFIQNAKNGQFGEFLEDLKLAVKKLVEIQKKFKCDILSNFQTMWL